MAGNLFEHDDSCPVCASTGGTCSDWLNDYTLLSLDPHANVEVPRDVYEAVLGPEGWTQRIKWRRGEKVTPEEAQRLGFGVPTFAEHIREEAEKMERETENKSLAPAENKDQTPPERFGPEGELSIKRNPHFGEDVPRWEWDPTCPGPEGE